MAHRVNNRSSIWLELGRILVDGIVCQVHCHVLQVSVIYFLVELC